MERFSWVGRLDYFFFRQVNMFFSVIISSSRWYLPEREQIVHLQIMLAASMSNAFDYHHSRQYLLFSSETISRKMAAINVYSVLLIWTRYMRQLLASGVSGLRRLLVNLHLCVPFLNFSQFTLVNSPFIPFRTATLVTSLPDKFAPLLNIEVTESKQSIKNTIWVSRPLAHARCSYWRQKPGMVVIFLWMSSWLEFGRGAKWSWSKLTINRWLGLGQYTAIFGQTFL